MPLASARSTLRSAPVSSSFDGLDRVERDVQLAREVVAAAAGDDRQQPLAVAQLARDGADDPVAAHRRDDVALVARLARELAGVLHGHRLHHPERAALAAQRGLHAGEQAERAATAGVGVDDQADGAVDHGPGG